MSPTALRRAQTYANVDVQSRADGSGPHEVVLMLFEGLLERIQLGKRALEQRDVANKVRHIDRAIQILSEGLRTHLDLKAGGELAQQLDSLYGYCLVRLLDANAHNDTAALDEVHRLLQPLAEAWRESRNSAHNPAPRFDAEPARAQPVGPGAYPGQVPNQSPGAGQRHKVPEPRLRFAA